MQVTLRRFCREDIDSKVRWINDPRNNRYLHYDLPLKTEGTLAWFERVKDRSDRLDLTILCDGIPVGITGLLCIDNGKKEAELYITVGEQAYKGRGVAGKTMHLLLQTAFTEYGLDYVYLSSETGNLPAIRAYEKFGWQSREVRCKDVRRADGTMADRVIYGMTRGCYEALYGQLDIADLSGGGDGR